jgi:hypothetical protein
MDFLAIPLYLIGAGLLQLLTLGKREVRWFDAVDGNLGSLETTLGLGVVLAFLWALSWIIRSFS